MLKLIGDMSWCVLSGIGIGFMTFLKVLPIYNKLGSIKEEIIACCIGVPAIVVSIVFMIPVIVKIIKKIKA